jgi:ABC-2 type transport system permease protein
LVAWLFVLEQGEALPREALSFTGGLLASVVLTVLLPLASLIFGALALGQEIEDGTLAYSLAKPTARWRLVVTKVVVAFAATLLTVLPGVWLTGWIVLGDVDAPIVRGFSVGVAVAALVYCAGFLALSLFTRRALIIGLLYVIGWEGSLSRLFAGTRTLSVREYATSLSEAVAGSDLAGPFTSPLEPTTAVLMSAVALGVAMGLAISRLRSLELVEEI